MAEKIWKVAVVGCGSFANGQYFPVTNSPEDACFVAVTLHLSVSEPALPEVAFR